MHHIKRIQQRYPIVEHGGEIFLIGGLNADKLFLSVMDELEEKILKFTNEVEEELNTIYDRVRSASIGLFEKINKLLDIKEDETVEKLMEAVQEVAVQKTKSDVELEGVADSMNERINSEFGEDFSILFMSGNRATNVGEYAEALKIKELSIKRMKQLFNLTRGLVSDAIDQINELYISILSYLKEKIKLFTDQIEDLISKEKLSNDIEKEDVNKYIPRTSLELKRHLRNEGFKLERQHGSHQIYKNEAGEVRMIPVRGGHHVLAHKTAKNIYSGVKSVAKEN